MGLLKLASEICGENFEILFNTRTDFYAEYNLLLMQLLSYENEKV